MIHPATDIRRYFKTFGLRQQGSAARFAGLCQLYAIDVIINGQIVCKVVDMAYSSLRFLAILCILATLGCNAATAGVTIPDPVVDAPLATAKGQQTAVIAGGCFWGIQAVFQHVKGVIRATSGYSGGEARTAEYEMVSNGNTGHAESVRIIYDPSQISYGQLLKVFFAVVHDPTQLNRQGPDTGTQYRSVIFFADGDQERIARAYIEQLNQAKVFDRPIVTEVVALKAFYEAEAYHQDYALLHPNDPYIMINDLPKVANLRKQLPALYRAK